MSPRLTSTILTVCLGCLIWGSLLSVSLFASDASGEADQVHAPEAIAFFENKVRPLLIEHCYACHSVDEDINGGLSLDSRHGWASGGDSGPVIVPGRPDESLLMTAVRYEDVDYEMPPDGKLKQSDIAILQRWIAMGAPDPRMDTPVTKPPSGSSTTAIAAEQLWSFQPITEPALPRVADPAWAGEPIDAFVRARLDEAGLPPAPPAENGILLRRLHLDLIGLPPTHDETQAFVRRCDENRNAAIAEVVERLLASPEFGGRWARHWLDLTAYADTLGVGRAIPAVEAYRYRDYVIDAFNGNKPLPEFIRQQIAGDIQVPPAPGQKPTTPPTAEDIIATGFLAIGSWELVSGDKEQLRMDVVDRQVNRIGKVFLGMTLECARCHAHKFDPVSQEDYFAMAGILRSSVMLHGRLNGVFSHVNHVSLPETPEELIERAGWIKQYEADLADAQRNVTEARREQVKLQTNVDKLKKQINEPGSPRPASGRGAGGEGLSSQDDASETVQVDELNPDLQVAEKELAKAKADVAKANKRVQVLDYLRRHRTERLAIAMSDRPEPEPAAINIRGSAHQLGKVVPRGFLRSIAPTNEPRLKIGTSGRLDLADWIAHRDNPLTARVWVNRIWHHLFGTGLVRTVDNFGSTGEPPSHPELLDYLAVGFQKPHVPLKAPREFFELYTAETLPLPPDFANEPTLPSGASPLDTRRNLDLYADRSFSTSEARAALHAYYACVSYMDAQLGRILDALETTGVSDNTLIVLWGDHGWHLSEKGFFAKGTLFEVAIRAPLIIVDPRRATSAGQTCRRVVPFVDIYPTLADLAGLPLPPALEGTSLRPLLDDPDSVWDRPAFTVQSRGWSLGRRIRTERWAYSEWDEEDQPGAMLFDHDSDPHELSNLAQDPAYAEVVATLKSQLRQSPIAAMLGPEG